MSAKLVPSSNVLWILEKDEYRWIVVKMKNFRRTTLTLASLLSQDQAQRNKWCPQGQFLQKLDQASRPAYGSALSGGYNGW
jgi:hypothetical protein